MINHMFYKELTSDWKQERPLGFLVQCYRADTYIGDEYRIFVEINPARVFAEEQQALSIEAGEQYDWQVYPLYASHPRGLDDLKEWD